MVRLTANPMDALMDEEIRLVVNDLDPHQNITVVARVTDQNGDIYESNAYYTADDFGTVDIFRDESKGGSYTGISSMGLFCFMIPSPGNKHQFTRFMIRDVVSPIQVHLTVHHGHLLLEDVVGEKFLSYIVVERRYKAIGVKRVTVRSGHLRGSLFIPEGIGPFPAIVDLFGSAGGLIEFRAALLASRGFLTLSLAYFSYDDLPEQVYEIDLEYLEEAKNFLVAHESSQEGGIGIIGVSAGGTIALAAATYINDYKCCISINGPVFAYYTMLKYKGRIWEPKVLDMTRVYIESNGLVLKRCIDDKFKMSSNCSSIIEYNKSKSSFLFMFSEDDKAINTAKHQVMAERLLRGSGVDYRVIVYTGAGHLLEPPFSPHTSVSYAKILGMAQNWGGTAKYHLLGQSNGWSDLLLYLREKLRTNLAKL